MAAAASLQGVLRDVRAAYAEQGHAPPVLVFGSSGSLARQIRAGAPYDVFASADAVWIERLARSGHIAEGAYRTYATGQLALVLHQSALAEGLPTVLRAPQMALLADPAVRVLALANPRTAPYGMAAQAALESAGLWARLESRVVYGDNVRQALTFVDTGNADAALVAMALVLGTERNWRAVDPTLHPPIRQTVAVLRRSERPVSAERFADFLAGSRAAPILSRHGLHPITAP